MADEYARKAPFLTKLARRRAAERKENTLHTLAEIEDTTVNQFEYAKVHQAKYHHEPLHLSLQVGARNRITTQPTNDDSLNEGDTESELADTICSVPSYLGGGRGCRPRPGAGSVVDFEQTSTIMVPPSEISAYGADPWTSNVTAEDLRRNFFRNFKLNTTLPIYRKRQLLVDSINSYSVTLIEGQTGCGKTTQVPTYILHDALLGKVRSPHAPVIYVTQPRRIAARSIAERICDEHQWQLGSIVGYQIGLERFVSPESVLVFCTSGVLLQKLIADRSLKGYSHIIIDEAHERDADTDLLLMMIRKLMREEESYFRLVVMSATMDTAMMRRYFTFKTEFGHRGVTSPTLCKVDGELHWPRSIQEIYFDRLKSTFNVEQTIPIFDSDEPELFEEALSAATEIILDIVPRLDTYSDSSNSTLVFLPGMAEIDKLHRMLKKSERSAGLEVIPIHSCLSSKDQVRVFMACQPGFRKVILATNIAESSITVPDVGVVIDFCLTKVLLKDPVTRFPTLQLQWSTKDKCTQRAGRTGRCCLGKVFRMVTQNFYRSFPEYAAAELTRAPIELSVLRVKNFNMGGITSLFAIVLEPPPYDEIKTAVLELKQIGALSSTYEGKLDDTDGDLTELGKVISALPIDVHLSKLIVMASAFDVLSDAIVVAACLSTNRTVMRHIYGDLLTTYENKVKRSKGSNSDLFVSLEVFREFQRLVEDEGRSQSYIERYCTNQGWDEKKLYEVAAMINEIRVRLGYQGIQEYEQPNRVRNRYEDELMLKVALSAAFYPNYFLSEPMKVDEIKKALGPLDPMKTVMLHNFPTGTASLYRLQVLKQLEPVCPEAEKNVDFLVDNSRAYLVFNNSRERPKDSACQAILGPFGIVDPARDAHDMVYRAVKYGQAERIVIREFETDAALKRKAHYDDSRRAIAQQRPDRMPPSWFKIIAGREADNSKFLESSDIEYQIFMNSDFFLEVRANEEQERSDGQAWASLSRIKNDFQRNRAIFAYRDNGCDFDSVYKDEIKTVRGPTSPIQLEFRPVVQKSRCYLAEVEISSVNSILLNADFATMSDRRQMLVAAAVTQSKKGRVLARDTTLMPNIRGLPSLMALLFAHYSKLIYNDQLKCLSGAIFGLGWHDEDQSPLSRMYEVEMSFDVLFSPDDIELINRARSTVSQLMNFVGTLNPGAPKAQLQNQLRQIVLSLIKRRRIGIEEVSILKINWDSEEDRRMFSLGHHNVPFAEHKPLPDSDTVRTFLPPLLVEQDHAIESTLREVRANVLHLKTIASGEVSLTTDGVRCLVCDSGQGDLFWSAMSVADHLMTSQHSERERSLLHDARSSF